MPLSRSLRRLAWFAAAVVLVPLSAAASDRPNLVVIVTDDHGYADVGFNGCHDIPTPHLDSIARRGVRFSSGYVTYSVCSPSRAGLLTGRYPQRFGHERNPRFLPDDRSAGLPLSETTLADTLGKIGYRNAAVGKWHLGAHPDLHPLRRGFHEFFGMLGGGHRYFPSEYTIRDTAQAKSEADSYRLWLMRDREPVPPSDQYLTDELSDAAVGFVARHRDKPFFLYLAYNAPHAPLQATEKYLSRFSNLTEPKRRTYAAMVSAVDDGVGRLLAELRRLGLEENTLVFFLSDNGGPTTVNGSRNTPLRGNKGDVWEGGFRVPFAAQWPARFPAGLTYDHAVSSLDIFATIAAVTGAPLDPARPLDGVNLLPFVTGQNSGAPHAAIYLRKFDQGAFAVRAGDFKLAIPKRGDAPRLYNLARDIAESQDLAAEQPRVVAELESLRAAWNARLVEPVFAGLSESPAAKKAPKAP